MTEKKIDKIIEAAVAEMKQRLEVKEKAKQFITENNLIIATKENIIK